MRCSLATAVAVALAMLVPSPINAAPHGVQELSWDDAYTKARALVGQMTLDQKVGMATGIGWTNGKCLGNTHAVQGPDFPSLCLQDGPLGIRFSDGTTAGVAGITAAASFDKDLLFKRGKYMGEESYGKGINAQLGPSVDIYRSPYAGRGWEAFGEDPYLQGVAGALTVKGIQSQGVIATGKHYILNNQEHHRTNSSSSVDERALHEIYVWPFARMVEAGVGSIMCSYNKAYSVYACENDYTINKVLKDELGFRGFVQSDWWAHHSTVASALAGLDASMPGDIFMDSGTSWWGANLTQAVKDGKVPEDRVTDMSVRIAAAWYKLRQDEGYPETVLDSFHRDDAPVVDVSDGHAALVREIGAAGVVLLKNSENILPLNQRPMSKLAVIGSAAGPNPDGVNSCPDRGCDKGTLAMGWGSGSVDFPYLVTPKDGIAARAGEGVQILYAGDDYDTAAASRVAADADMAIVVSTADSGEEYIIVDGNEGDRNNLTLWGNGDRLIEAVAEANNNTIVVIHSVGPVLMPWIDHPNIKAVVWPGLPGQESGNSLADVLFGQVNPSGRLPYTIAKQESDYNVRISPDYEINYTEGLEVGYKHFDAQGIEPLYEFGYGLSYTTFEYSNLKVVSNMHATATVNVRNSGKVDGAEVVQAYIGFPKSAGEPPKLLRGFEKVFVKAGAEHRVQFEFGRTELSIWQDGRWVVPEGEYTLFVGASSRDIRQSTTFTL